VADRDPYRYFRVEARELVDQLGQGALELERDDRPADVVARMLRHAHTLKGAARVVRLPGIADRTHTLEEELGAHRDAPGPLPPGRAAYLIGMVDELSAEVSAIPAPQQPPAAQPVPHAATAGGTAPGGPAASAPGGPPRDAGGRPPVERRDADQPPTGRRGAHPEPLLVGRTDAGDVDELLDVIAETQTRIAPLRDGVGQVERIRRGMRLLVAQLDSPATGTAATGRLRTIVTGLDGELAAFGRALSTTVEHAERDLRQVRAGAERLRLVPAGTIFPALQRAVRDAADVQERPSTFTGEGGTIRLDPQVLSSVYGALLHVVRNAVAHGIEPPRQRAAAGKPPEGTVHMTVERHGDRIRFAVRDDGRGFDLAALRRAASDAGVPASAGLSAGELVDLTLRGGISTSGAVTAVAGRGVGLDAVRDVAERLGGSVDVESVPGRGTAVVLAVPLSLLALDAMTVEAAGTLASIPLDAVTRTVRVAPGDVARTGSGASVRHDGAAVPLLALSRVLAPEATSRVDRLTTFPAVVISTRTGTAAIAVDRLLGTDPVVVRGLPPLARAGATVSGVSLDDAGNPRLVLDPDGLVAAAHGVRPDDGPVAVKGAPDGPLLVIDDSLTTRMLERSILESAGFRVDVAADAEEGLDLARATRYALILVDIEMPGMDGYTFVETIRADPDLRDIPAILVSSLADPVARARGVAAGANLHVAKHEFNQNDLIDQIRKLVRSP
jgi:two-component system chemotaxis sensor kinase CheA